jgi:RimJ/RimL family protein N-acetyltransferase
VSPAPAGTAPKPAFRNALGQPIGFPVDDWQVCPPPPRTILAGRTCRVEPLDPERHAAALHDANLEDRENRIWTYLPYGPFATLADYRAWMTESCLGDDPLFHAVVDTADGAAAGVASYLRIDPPVGVIEVGHINFAPRLQHTTAATEAMYLMMRRVFDELGIQRSAACALLDCWHRRAGRPARLGRVCAGKKLRGHARADAPDHVPARRLALRQAGLRRADGAVGAPRLPLRAA